MYMFLIHVVLGTNDLGKIFSLERDRCPLDNISNDIFFGRKKKWPMFIENLSVLCWIFQEFIYYIVYCVLIFIAVIVCLARGAQYSHGGIIAATVSCSCQEKSDDSQNLADSPLLMN